MSSKASPPKWQPQLNGLQTKLIGIFRRMGPMTTHQLLSLPELSAYTANTLRCRQGELAAMGEIVKIKTVRNHQNQPVAVWEAAP